MSQAKSCPTAIALVITQRAIKSANRAGVHLSDSASAGPARLWTVVAALVVAALVVAALVVAALVVALVRILVR